MGNTGKGSWDYFEELGRPPMSQESIPQLRCGLLSFRQPSHLPSHCHSRMLHLCQHPLFKSCFEVLLATCTKQGWQKGTARSLAAKPWKHKVLAHLQLQNKQAALRAAELKRAGVLGTCILWMVVLRSDKVPAPIAGSPCIWSLTNTSVCADYFILERALSSSCSLSLKRALAATSTQPPTPVKSGELMASETALPFCQSGWPQSTDSNHWGEERGIKEKISISSLLVL